MGSEDKEKSLIHSLFSLDDPLVESAKAHDEPGGVLGESGVVPMDVIETSDSLIVELDIPGVNIADVSVTIKDDCLVVEGIKRETFDVGEKPDFLLMERGFGPFSRMLKIPFAVVRDAIEAVYWRGVLVITIPKLTERRKTAEKIPIKYKKEI
ncbi:MAG TPA: Hsp20/alpha crystallin family protein [Nitrospirae bacterium]|nr:Hsp20/alpha crystallin family protein [Nitrospirota bacterium]